MEFKLDDSNVSDGTILLFGVRYVNEDRSETSKVFTYAGLKAGGRWYLTGSGRVPQDAGWGAVQRWLDDPGRQVVWVRAVTQTAELWPYPGAHRQPYDLGDHEATARDGVPGGILGGELCAFCGRERSRKDDNHAPDCPWTIWPSSLDTSQS